MTRMLALVGLTCFLLSSLASAQSLAEVARKEKQRRDSVKTTGKTIDDEALKNAIGDGLSVTGVQVAPEGRETSRGRSESATESTPNGAGPGDGGESQRPSSDREAADEREAHRRAWENAVMEAEEHVAALQQSAKDCAYAQARPRSYATVGCEGIQDRVKKAQQHLQQIRSQRYNWERR